MLKKWMLLSVFVLLIGVNTAKAQPYPYPQSCYVDLIDNYTRQTVQRFVGQVIYGAPVCREGLRQCNQFMHQNGYPRNRYTCQSVGSYPNPNPFPPTPYPGYNRSYFLSMNDYQLISAGLNNQVGLCSLSRGGYNSYCSYYMRVGGYSYPDSRGTGCTRAEFTHYYGCNYADEGTNAACLMRLALNRGECGF